MTDLLQTKLFKPTLLRSLVPRTRLTKKLDKGLAGKVTIVSAPAGFGKTSVIAAWLAHMQRPLGWLSLDEEDNDPHRFFTFLAAAFAPIAMFAPEKGTRGWLRLQSCRAWRFSEADTIPWNPRKTMVWNVLQQRKFVSVILAT